LSCAARAVLGAPFYVVQRVHGVIARGALPAGYADSPAERVAMTEGLVDVLADLHAVDPAATGRGDFGGPGGDRAGRLRGAGRLPGAAGTALVGGVAGAAGRRPPGGGRAGGRAVPLGAL